MTVMNRYWKTQCRNFWVSRRTCGNET